MEDSKRFTLTNILVTTVSVLILVALGVSLFKGPLEKKRSPDYVVVAELATDKLMEKYVRTYFSPMGEIKVGCIQLLNMSNGERFCTAAFQNGAKETPEVISAVCTKTYCGCSNLSRARE